MTTPRLLTLTDGGIETTLIFHQGIALREFAAFELLSNEAGTEALAAYYTPYLDMARRQKVPFVLESPTWRASGDWGTRLGYSRATLADFNRKAIDLMFALRGRYDDVNTTVSGCIGPRGDGYVTGNVMSIDAAARYHGDQVTAFAQQGVDRVTAITMTNVPEAIGIAQASAAEGLPVVVSFTVETNGRLPSGTTLRDAIAAVDDATGRRPAFYMINCAHPSHFEAVLRDDAPWRDRIGGVRANASRKSHAELDEAAELDEGDPAELARDHGTLRALLPNLHLVGGCCGTDHRHVAAIAAAWHRG